jgi:hypothetical protein
MQGLSHCEFNLERNTVHACHAAVIVHLLEGWGFHEVRFSRAISLKLLDTLSSTFLGYRAYL